MDFFGDLSRGLGVIGQAVGGNTAPLRGAVANTVGVQPNVFDAALQQAMRPGYQQAGYSSPAGPLATPLNALTGAAGRAAGSLGR